MYGAPNILVTNCLCEILSLWLSDKVLCFSNSWSIFLTDTSPVTDFIRPCCSIRAFLFRNTLSYPNHKLYPASISGLSSEPGRWQSYPTFILRHNGNFSSLLPILQSFLLDFCVCCKNLCLCVYNMLDLATPVFEIPTQILSLGLRESCQILPGFPVLCFPLDLGHHWSSFRVTDLYPRGFSLICLHSL